MKKIIGCFLMLAVMLSCIAVKKGKDGAKGKDGVSAKKEFFIDSTLVKKHLYTLASDAMEGRKSGTSGIEKAAVYIENEFKKDFFNFGFCIVSNNFFSRRNCCLFRLFIG